MIREGRRSTLSVSFARQVHIFAPRIVSPKRGVRRTSGRWGEGPVVIFDCNGVLVDSEMIAADVAAREFTRAGFPLTPEIVARYFTGRRPSDMFAAIETAYRAKLPPELTTVVTAMILQRLRTEVRPTRHMEYALSWLRGPKCVASSSPIERVRVSLDATGLLRFFEPHLFSASDVPRGKPAPDLFFYVAAKMGVAPAECIVVEDSPAGIAAATAAGMTCIGFVGGSHAGPNLEALLTNAGARAVIADMRALKSTVVALRGW
jgi:HAD superfamily hydrolase (TIGR01509 family)